MTYKTFEKLQKARVSRRKTLPISLGYELYLRFTDRRFARKKDDVELFPAIFPLNDVTAVFLRVIASLG